MQPTFQMTEFQKFLQTTGLGEASRKQIVTSMRRAIRHLGPERLLDPNEMASYRLTLPEATNRVFVYSWGKFQKYAESLGESIPDLPKLPTFKIVHPLWADLTDLSIHLNVNALPSMRWRDVLGTTDPDFVEKPARRAFEFITGREPLEIDWLVPRDASAEGAMPFWMLDSILRTNPTERDKDVEKSAFSLLQSSTRRGISASDLKALWRELEACVSTIAGRRRIIRLDALEIDLNEPWGVGDQELVMSVLSGAKLREVPSGNKMDTSGTLIVLRDSPPKIEPSVAMTLRHAIVPE